MICEYLTVCPQEAGLAVIKTPPTLKIRGVEANFALPKGKSLSLFILSDDSLSLLLCWKVDSAWASRFSLDLSIYKAE